MPLQDFTTYTEVDAAARITVINARVTATNLVNSDDGGTQVAKDFTAGFFDALDTVMTIVETSRDAGTGAFDMISWTAGIANNGRLGFASTDLGLALNDDAAGGTLQRIVIMRGNFTVFDVCDTVALGTISYIHVVRAAGNDTVTCNIYSDVGRTTLVDSIVVTGFGTATWRYFAPLNHTFQANVKKHSTYVENLNFSSAADPSTDGVTFIPYKFNRRTSWPFKWR